MENYMIFAICHHGYAGDIMTIARKAGAKGGTIVKARGSASNEVAKFFGITIQPEKEMVMIIVPENLKEDIMKAIIQNAGVQTEAHAITFSIKLDQVIGINV